MIPLLTGVACAPWRGMLDTNSFPCSPLVMWEMQLRARLFRIIKSVTRRWCTAFWGILPFLRWKREGEGGGKVNENRPVPTSLFEL